jgi:exodeoxyribonuclease VII large subunit
MSDIVLTPSDFVGLLNQTLEIAYPVVIIEGELSSFRISKNRWVYFDLKDEFSSVSFFGSIYQLPGPLQDGLSVRVVGNPRYHPKFGFSISFQSIQPVGEGALKKAADLLAKKLEIEGLFAAERKRLLPSLPEKIGLITAASSAAYADFIKIINERWGGLEIQVIDVLVQGDNAPAQLVEAVQRFNSLSSPPDVLVMTRGGGSLEDLAAFSDERVVRAVAASRIPMLVAVGHEVDVSLAELAADQRASTPTNAAGLLTPDRKQEISNLEYERKHLALTLKEIYESHLKSISSSRQQILIRINNIFQQEKANLASLRKLAQILDPRAALSRGYAIVRYGGDKYLKSVTGVKPGDRINIELADGKLSSEVREVINAN